MGRGLSELQKHILKLAYENRQQEKRADGSGGADVYKYEVLWTFYKFGDVQPRKVRRVWQELPVEIMERQEVGDNGMGYDILKTTMARGRYVEYQQHYAGYKERNGKRTQASHHFDIQAIGKERYQAAHAAVTRAFQRLEDRGYGVRIIGFSKWTGLNLTEAGITAAQELTVKEVHKLAHIEPLEHANG